MHAHTDKILLEYSGCRMGWRLGVGVGTAYRVLLYYNDANDVWGLGVCVWCVVCGVVWCDARGVVCGVWFVVYGVVWCGVRGGWK
jgi:hypothetical protein